MMQWDHTTDVLIVGSGGGALVGALAAAANHLGVIVLEKTDLIGGSTAMSGGGIWIPDNPLMRAEGIDDSAEAALAYFDAVIGDAGPASSLERRKAYVEAGPRMVGFLQDAGIRFGRTDGWCDYYSEAAGASVRSRGIEAVPFDIKLLGQRAAQLRPGMTAALGFVASGIEFLSMSSYNRSFDGLLTSARVTIRTVVSKATRKRMVANGTALIGWLLLRATERHIPIWTESPLEDLVFEGDRVAGAVVRRDGRNERVRVRRGVLLAAGGFSRNSEMRKRFGGEQATDALWSRANPGDTGEVLEIAIQHGAAAAQLDEAIWNPAPLMPDGTPPNFPGTVMTALSSRVRYRPGTIMVGADGQRFVSESLSYMELGQRMFARDRVTRAVPTWLIFDERFRRRNLFGRVPGRLPSVWIDGGFVMRAGSLGELAQQCGIDKAGLMATISRFNEFARNGRDEDFSRGESEYERFFGDPRIKPNPCLAPVDRPPFYAVAYFPTDVGTCGGVLTDEHARVLNTDGEPIVGLYATGNVSATVMGRKYLGAGASIGNTMTFGFVAAEHLAGIDAE